MFGIGQYRKAAYTWLLLGAALAVPVYTGAQPTITCEHGVSRKTCQKVSQQIVTLSQGTTWTWVIEDRPVIWAGSTYREASETDINVRYMDSTTIPHELGHILTGSPQESDADRKGAELCPRCYDNEKAKRLVKMRSGLSGKTTVD